MIDLFRLIIFGVEHPKNADELGKFFNNIFNKSNEVFYYLHIKEVYTIRV